MYKRLKNIFFLGLKVSGIFSLCRFFFKGRPLLETGTVDEDDKDGQKTDARRVAFIGISNWALDPAKMNRGILLSRGEPDREDLIKSANGISSAGGDKRSASLMATAIPQLTDGYLRVRDMQAREYFGLRDFYTLVKMVRY